MFQREIKIKDRDEVTVISINIKAEYSFMLETIYKKIWENAATPWKGDGWKVLRGKAKEI